VRGSGAAVEIYDEGGDSSCRSLCANTRTLANHSWRRGTGNVVIGRKRLVDPPPPSARSFELWPENAANSNTGTDLSPFTLYTVRPLLVRYNPLPPVSCPYLVKFLEEGMVITMLVFR
jgi:hypothetical protein